MQGISRKGGQLSRLADWLAGSQARRQTRRHAGTWLQNRSHYNFLPTCGHDGSRVQVSVQQRLVLLNELGLQAEPAGGWVRG